MVIVFLEERMLGADLDESIQSRKLTTSKNALQIY